MSQKIAAEDRNTENTHEVANHLTPHTQEDQEWTPFKSSRKSTQNNNGVSTTTTNTTTNGISTAANTTTNGASKMSVTINELKDKRIRQLEKEVVGKDQFIAELVAQLDECDVVNKKLQAEIFDLRKEVARKAEPVTPTKVTTQPFVALSGASTLWSDEVEADETEKKQELKVETVKKPVESEDEAVKESVKKSVESKSEPEKKTVSDPDSEPDFVKIDLPKVENQAPVAGPDLPALPKLSSPPPASKVKPAPKLFIPIVNGGKITKTKTEAKSASKTNDTIPDVLTAKGNVKDIRAMTPEEREALFRGPTITALVGNDSLYQMPKHLFMTVSPLVRKYFLENPTNKHISFPVGAVMIPTLSLIKNWLIGMGTQKSIFSVSLQGDAKKDLTIRRNCMFLGMDKYVAHFTRQYCDKVREGFPGKDLITQIGNNTKDGDALWECLVNNLAMARHKNLVPDPAKFEAFLADHPRLEKAIVACEINIREKFKPKVPKGKKGGNGGNGGTHNGSGASTPDRV